MTFELLLLALCALFALCGVYAWFLAERVTAEAAQLYSANIDLAEQLAHFLQRTNRRLDHESDYE